MVAVGSVQYVNVPRSEPAVTAATVISTVAGGQTVVGFVMTRLGAGTTVTMTGVLKVLGHTPT